MLRVVVAKEGGQTGTYEITKDAVRFGRSPECEVRLDGKNISRVHCIVEVRAGELWVRDNDSLNGIFVNGEKVKEAILTPRDAVKIGAFRFKALVTGTMPMGSKISEERAVVPAAPEMDRTMPAFDVKKSEEEMPVVRGRASSAGLILDDSGEDRTPVDGHTPVAGSPAAILAEAEAALPAVKTPARTVEIAPAPAPVKSYRAAFEKSVPKVEVSEVEAPWSTPVKKADSAAPVPQPRPAPLSRPLPPPPARAGRMSLTKRPATPKNDAVRPGDACDCGNGLMLTWLDGVRCRACGTTMAIGTKNLKSERAPIEAKAPIAGTRSPIAESKDGSVRPGDACDCGNGLLLTWLDGVRCRACGTTMSIDSRLVGPSASRSAPHSSLASGSLIDAKSVKSEGIARIVRTETPRIEKAAAKAETRAEAPASSRSFEVSAKELGDAFRQDCASANQKYSGRSLLISGEVKFAGESQDGTPIALLAEYQGGVAVLFPRELETEVEALEIGERITIRATCRTKMPFESNAVVDQASFVDVTPKAVADQFRELADLVGDEEGGALLRQHADSVEKILEKPTSRREAEPSNEMGARREAERPTKGGSNTDEVARLGESCPSCSRGLMLTWEGGLRCRACGNRAELEKGVSREAKRAPAISKSAPAAKSAAASAKARPAQPQTRGGVAAMVGIGLMIGVYGTILTGLIARSLLM